MRRPCTILLQTISIILFLETFTSILSAPTLMGATYRKATEGREVIKRKLYPRTNKAEVNGNFGAILNQSYVNTFLVGGSINYFFTESYGISVKFDLGLNTDKSERTCIESFFYDPDDEVSSACGEPSLLANTEDGFPRYGPAYVPIREISTITALNFLWSPIYGKQLLLLSATSYFDLFIEAGVGFATSDFYEKRDVLRNGNEPRAPKVVGGDNAEEKNERIGARADDRSVDGLLSYGIEGRPDPESQFHPIINLGVGQKFHFARLFFINVDFRYAGLVGTSQGFESLFILQSGIGARF